MGLSSDQVLVLEAVEILSVIDISGQSSQVVSRSYQIKLSEYNSLLQIVYQTSVVLEKTQYSSPNDLVASLEQHLMWVMADDSRFTVDFLSRCVELGSLIKPSSQI